MPGYLRHLCAVVLVSMRTLRTSPFLFKLRLYTFISDIKLIFVQAHLRVCSLCAGLFISA